MPAIAQPRLYHIDHLDRLTSIIEIPDLPCDYQVIASITSGTTIGINNAYGTCVR
ncbi:hypothetical protein SAMN05421755_100428 [Nitrosomonas sp. Nm33]|nr:hypothetical protein SAMN05421755_100428 [Nitrosomonas sp. Nm33]